jgi:prepilin-type N-terminal cleavage/methylation domain-containing protein
MTSEKSRKTFHSVSKRYIESKKRFISFYSVTSGRRAFTLIETMLAVLIMALLASAAALSFSGPVRKARAREAVDQVIAADRSARQEAHDSGRAVRLRFDSSNGEISRIEGTATQFRSVLPASFRISDVLVGRRVFRDVPAEVGFSGSGFSATYAVHLSGTGADRWVVFAGLTGQANVVSDEQAVRTAIDSIAPARRDTD